MSVQVPKGYKQTEVGVIPEDWECQILDELAKRGSGHTPNKKIPDYWNGSIKWISLRDSDVLDKLFIEDTAVKISKKGLDNSSAVLHPAGTVVLSRDAGVGKSAIMKYEMAVSQHFMAWQCKSYLNNKFLYFYLQAKKNEFERIAMGSTIKTIGLPYFKELKIPKPSIEEQQAIAEALSDADALIESLEQLIAKKRQMKQGAMQELLTGQRRLPGFSGEWKRKKLGDICDIRMGRTPSRLNPHYWGAGHKWLSISDLKAKYIFESNEEITSLAACEMQVIPKGSLLMSFKLSLGRLAFAGCDLYTNEAICSFQGLNANTQFLYYILGRTDFSLYGKQAVKGYTLNKESLKTIEILMPPLDEQNAIAEVLSSIDCEIDELNLRLNKVRQIKQSMMQELLTGRIRLI